MFTIHKSPLRLFISCLLSLYMLLTPFIPSTIPVAHALTTNKSFTFASSSESFTGSGGAKSTLSYSFVQGNPSGSIETVVAGRNASDTPSWTWTGTWEDLGVPAGSTVTNIRINSGYTRVTQWATVSSVTIGPYKLQDGSGVDQATLWSGRTPTGTDGGWVSISAQSDQSVPVALQTSSSTVKLYLGSSVTLGNDKNASTTFYQDQLTYTITYAAAVSVSLTTNGTVSFGTLALNSSRNTSASDLNDVETISIDSGPATLYIKSNNFTQSSNTWTLGSGNGSNQVLWEYSPDGTSWNTFLVANTNYTLATNVSQGNTQNLYLRLTTPTTTSSYNQFSSTVTITAAVP